MKEILRNHCLALIVACVVGLATLVPQLVATYRLGDQYQGVPVLWEADDLFYVARGRDVIDGYPTLGNPYLYERKHETELQFWIPDAIVAWFGWYLFSDYQTGALVLDLVVPIVLALLLYATIYEITRSRLISISGMVFAHIGVFLEDFGRSPSPQLNAVFSFVLAYFILRAINSGRMKWYVSASVVFGSLFYIYTYFWTYWTVTLIFASLFIWVIAKRKDIALRLLGTFLGGLALGIPYFLRFHEASTLPYYTETLERIALIYSHKPTGLFIVLCSVAVVAFFIALIRWKKISIDPQASALLAFVVAGGVVMNQQIVTGKIYSFTIHYHLVSVYAMILLGSWMIKKYEANCELPNKKLFLRIIAGGVVACSFLASVNLIEKQIDPMRGVSSQRYAPVFAWLNEHTKKDDVVYTDDELARYVPAYTHNNVYYAREANLFYVPQREIEHRFVAQHYFARPYGRSELLRDERQIFGTYYMEQYAHEQSANRYKRLLGLSEDTTPRYPEEKIAELVAEINASQGKQFKEVIMPYRADILVWDRVRNPAWNIDAIPELKKITDIGEFSVYQIVI